MSFVKLTYPWDFAGTGKRHFFLDAKAVTGVTPETGETHVRCGGTLYHAEESAEQVLEMVLAAREKAVVTVDVLR